MNEKFIEVVKAGKIEELLFHDDVLYCGSRSLGFRELSGAWCWYDAPRGIDMLCAHLRRWLKSKGAEWELDSCGMLLRNANVLESVVIPYAHGWDEGSELDWHIEAVLYVLEGRS